MSFQTIRHAQQAIWPKVMDSLDRHRAQREAVKKDPNPTTAAKARARKPWNRVVCEETVWALAKDDLLYTSEHQAVITAAREWVRTAPEDFLDDMDPEEEALYKAVQKLATAFDPYDDEDLPLEAKSDTVPSSNSR